MPHRFLEIVPGVSAWGTLILLVLLSWKIPAFVAVFIVLFDLYWLLKIVYLYFNLRFSFVAMKKNEKIDWLLRLKEEKSEDWEKLRHLVVYPVYKESYDVVRAGIISILKTNYPNEKILIALALEERAGDQVFEIGKRAKEEFEKKFGVFFVSYHPANLPGEIPGKGSNDTYAVKKMKAEVIDKLNISYDDIIVSVFDIDTHPGKEYFGILSHKFLNEENPTRASYQPIPIYTNNFHKVSPFARLIGFSSTFWQLMQQARPEQLVTFSSHSIPFRSLSEVGFWHTDIVSEDSRIFFQCLTHFNGNWKVVPLLYPVYMDAVSGKTFFEAMKNLYKQQRRWAWGIENFPFMIREFAKKKEIPRRIKHFWTLLTFDGFYSWATSSFVIFLFGWLPNILGGDLFRTTLFSYNLPRITGYLVNFSTIGIITSAFLTLLLIPRNERVKKRYYLFYLLQWILMPFTFIVFGSIPALESQTRMMLGGKFKLGFWVTPKDSRGK